MLIISSLKTAKNVKSNLYLTQASAFSLYIPEFTETGVVTSTGDGVAKVYGLKNVQVGELVEV
jgi:F0F1-type ATP synthase alpha subunit